jgi:PAS domain S-box-containing protein
MILTPDKGFVSGNPATIKLFGCQKEDEFISLTPADLSPEYQPDGALSAEKAQKMMAIARAQDSHFFEWNHKRVNGKEFYASVLLTRMNLYGEEVLQATVRDITERKQAEAELAKYRDHLEEMVRERTAELTRANQQLRQHIAERKRAEDALRERTAELQTMVNVMAGREVRMAELKKVIQKLRAQLEEAGLTPVADDPLKEMAKETADGHE